MPVKKKWIITAAWPYVNATPHLGNMIGSTLSADVFARYLRLKGDEVVFVSGSDMHGTPVAVAAKKQNIPVENLAMTNHDLIKDLYKKWRISYDNYTQTHNPIHIKFTQDFYLDIQKNGYIFEKEIESLYCKKDNLFLADRYVLGTCPYCGFESARGDQCDNPTCGKILTPMELKQPKCAICGSKPEIKTTKHWYMDFPKLQERLENLIIANKIIPPNARQMCLNGISEGLPERAITRDLEWGIPAKFEGAEGKSIYVWFEAVLGYISAVKEWAENIIKEPKKFDHFWKDPNSRAVYFIGKDNIIFHLIVFPGLLLAYNDNKPDSDKFILPYNVSSTEFLMYENDKFSKSRGVGIWIDQALDLAPLDYWRFNLIYNRPEKSDTSFLWSEFDNNIKILNDIVGNFVHRTLTFIKKQFGGKIPAKLEMDKLDKDLIEKINSITKKVGDALEEFEFKKAIREVINFGTDGNTYLSEKAPWHLIKENKAAAGHVFNLCVQCVYALGITLAPFLPDTSEKILKLLNISKPLSKLSWESVSENSVKEGITIEEPQPLFQKFEIEELKEKLKNWKPKVIESKESPKEELVSYDYFKKFDIRIALVEKVEKVTNADKLYKLSIDLGTEKRTLVAGLAEYYKAEELAGKKIVILANLEPRTLKGIKSQGMLLAADDGKIVSVLTIDKDIKPGAKIS